MRNEIAEHTLQEIKSSFVGHISREEEFRPGDTRVGRGHPRVPETFFAGLGVSTIYKLEARCSIRIPRGNESTRYYLV